LNWLHRVAEDDGLFIRFGELVTKFSRWAVVLAVVGLFSEAFRRF
jgi:hypothetical protein